MQWVLGLLKALRLRQRLVSQPLCLAIVGTRAREPALRR